MRVLDSTFASTRPSEFETKRLPEIIFSLRRKRQADHKNKTADGSMNLFCHETQFKYIVHSDITYLPTQSSSKTQNDNFRSSLGNLAQIYFCYIDGQVDD
jgi:hypothetical protein